MENIITTGKISGKRSRSRTTTLKDVVAKENNELIHSVRDRIKYREMIANVIQQST